MPEFILISELKENLYKEGCPVVIRSGGLSIDDESQSLFAHLCFKSIADKVITSVLVDLHVFDRANIEVEVIRDYLYLVEAAQRDREFGGDMPIEVMNPASKTISVALRRVAFQDDTVWDGTASLLYEAIPARRTIRDDLEDNDTVEQFARDFSANIATVKTIVPQYVPVEHKDLWLCACGEINREDEDTCYTCGAAYLPQRTHIDNRVEIAANLDAYKRDLAEKAEQARQTAQRLAAEAAQAKAEAERLAAEEKARLEAQVIRRKRIKKTIIAVSIPTIIAIFAYLIVLFTYLIPQGNYDTATGFLDDGRYDEAITAFSAMNGYSDSDAKVSEAKFQKAESLLAEKKYEEAITLYTSIEKEKDVADRISEAKYQRGTELLASETYEDALTLFTEISGYKDSGEKIALCHYSLAEAAIANSDLPTATSHFTTLTDENSLKIQQQLSDKGSALYKEGQIDTAKGYFALVTDTAVLEQINQVYYDGAMALITDNKLYEAAELLETISAYKDSSTQILRVRYLKAVAFQTDGSYAEAIALYEKADGYEDSAQKITECKYSLAAAAYDAADYAKAAEQFEALGDYSDSGSRRINSIYQLGVQQLNNGETMAAYETLFSIKSYDDAFILLVSTKQFYFDIYNPGIAPVPVYG